MTGATERPLAARLNKAGVARIITVVLTLAVTALIFFLAAGTFQASRAWLYYGGVLAYLVAAMAVIFRFFPEAIETVNARGKLNRDVKTWDKLFGLCYVVLYLLQPALAGWDVRTKHSFDVPWHVAVLALAVTILAYALIHWAMLVNKHAETGVRIQEERDHSVISSGPYRIVRHPFYVSAIASHLIYPLALGSPHAAIPAVAIALLVVWRTAREDEVLCRELEGYEAFTKHTRYRLVPGVW